MLTRRELLRRTAASTLAAPAVRSAPPPAVKPLRILTLGIEWPQGMHEQAQFDLGFPIRLQVATSRQAIEAALAAPESFDVFGGYSYQSLRVWFAGHLRPVDTRRIAAWRDFYRLFARGKLSPGPSCPYGVGDAPFRSLFLGTGTRGLPPSSADATRTRAIVQWIDERTDRPFADAPMPRYVVGAPAHFAAESLGYLLDVIPRAPGHVSWKELLNRRWKGRVAIQNEPAVGLVDLGRAVQTLGIMRIRNVGAMTIPEIDRLVKILTVYRKQGQFRPPWSSFNDVVNMMASKDVALSPVWPSAAARIAAEGVRIVYANPPEGYRGSCSSIGISARVPHGPRLDACYAYLNWLYSGYFGATMMRQGYYIANGARLPSWIDTYGASLLTGPFTAAEYRYWYDGLPARYALPDIKGVPAIKPGARREGGSIRTRMCRCTAWSSYFHSAGYQARRFRDFTG